MKTASLFLLILATLLVYKFVSENDISPKKIQVQETSESPEQESEISEQELSDRVGQMIMIGFRGKTLDSETESALRELNIGGVVLFDYDTPTKKYDRNIESPEQLAMLVRSLQDISDKRMFIAVDAEGGNVNRLKSKYGFTNIPSHQELGGFSLEETKRYSKILGEQLRDLGINVNFAPVVDVNINPDNPIIGGFGRSFSGDPEIVINHAKAFIEGQKESGILSVIKHFPGHGSSVGDTHKGVVDITDVYKEEELKPFADLIDAGVVNAVMSAHIIDRNIDEIYPASLSKKHIEENLRSGIDFDGLVFSDDIDMRAISNEFSLEVIVELAINSGVDVIVSSNNITGYKSDRALDIHKAIIEAIKSEEIPVSRIIESSDRIKNIKENY
ncbi:glycoside hydrolase family 3 protein [Candidatus Parcubacteria bacterium]|nr:glycoside hydrolase family 3 protein [Candidatus Parcubacteria bacterium]